MNDEMVRMCKKVVVYLMEVLSWNLPRGTEENYGNLGLVADIIAEIRNRQLLNTSRKWYHFSQLSW
jgi:hypothetical protein